MQKPEFRTRKLSSYSSVLDSWLSTWYMRYFFLPLSGAIPLGLAVTFLSSNELLNRFDTLLPPRLLSWLHTYQIFLILLVTLVLVLSQGLRHLIAKLAEPDCEVDQDEMLAVFDALHEVVNAESKSLYRVTPKALKKHWKHAKLYRETIDPHQQIFRLVAAVNGVFECITGNQVAFRTRLVVIKDSKPVEWFTYCPLQSPPITSFSELSVPTSAIMQTISTGRMVLISDMRKELAKKEKNNQRCVRGGLADNESASLLAFPIYCPHTHEPVYVLTTTGKRANCLNEAHTAKYDWLLQHFLARIILEHHTMLMKQDADG